jgi:tetratricopeptide (TPR) repeat protein
MMFGTPFRCSHHSAATRTRARPGILIGICGALLLVLLTACRSPQSSRSGAEDPSDAAYWSEEAVENRAQGHAHYGAAILSELAGEDPEVVLDHLRQAALAEPTHEGLVLRVADRMLGLEKYEAAAAFLDECLQIPRPPASYYARLALAYARQDKFEEAVQANRDSLDRDPSFLLAYQNLIRVYAELQEQDAAWGVIREAARQTCLDPAFFVAVAEFYFAYGRMHPDNADVLKGETKVVLDRAAALKPQDAILIAFLAEGYKRLGDLEQAEVFYRDWLERYPHQTMAWENLAELYLYSGNRAEAAELLRKLLDRQPEHRRATYVLGTLAFEEGQLEEAKEFLSRAIVLQPELKPAYYQLAAVQLTLGETEETLATLNLVRKRFEGVDFSLAYYTALAHVRAERWQLAVKHFTEAEIIGRAADNSPLNEDFYFQFGAACERQGDYETAARHFRRCLGIKADFAEALNYLGYMWAEQGENLDEARGLIERAVELEPENAAFLDSLGWVWFRLGDAGKALPWLEKAVGSAEEPDPTLFDHLGDVYEALGQHEEARELWRRALRLGADPDIQRKLDAAAEP